MAIPQIAIVGVTSNDPDFTPVVSKKSQLLADSRITRWFAARDGDVTVSGTDATKIATMIDRKVAGNGSALATDATRPVMASLAAYGARKAVQFTAGADRSISLPAIDLSGSAWFVAVLARRASVDAANGDALFWTGVTNQVLIAAPASGSVFQVFRNTNGVNVNPGNASPDATPKLIFGSWDGVNVKGASGSSGAVSSVAGSGGAVAAGSAAFIGKRASVPALYWGGDVAQVIIGNVDILATANADLRALIAGYLGEYYSLSL